MSANRSRLIPVALVAAFCLMVVATQAGAQCPYQVLLSDSNDYSGAAPVWGFNGSTWTALASLPASNWTQLANDEAGNYYAMPGDGNVYRYDCATNAWTLVMTGPAAAAGAGPIAMFEVHNGCYYWGKDGGTALYWTCNGTWSSVTTSAVISSASSIDRQAGVLYLRTWIQIGHQAFDISAGGPTPHHTCTDATYVGENARVGTFANGRFWTRSWSGSWVGTDATCAQVTGATPTGEHVSSAADGTGGILSVGYGSTATSFERFNMAAGTMTTLPAAPSTNHSTIAAAADGTVLVAVPVVAGMVPTAGPVDGGTVVVITGTGFTGATAVMFGGSAAASFTVDSDTQITAVSPAHPVGPVYVTVTTPGGTSAQTAASIFTFSPQGVAVPAVGTVALAVLALLLALVAVIRR